MITQGSYWLFHVVPIQQGFNLDKIGLFVDEFHWIPLLNMFAMFMSRIPWCHGHVARRRLVPRVRAVPAVPGICWSKPSVQRQQRQQKQHRHRRHRHRQRGRPETAMKLTPKSLTARRTKSSRPCHGSIWWSWWAWPIFSISYTSHLQSLVILLCVCF